MQLLSMIIHELPNNVATQSWQSLKAILTTGAKYENYSVVEHDYSCIAISLEQCCHPEADGV